jgi:hypothetical protein
MKPPKKLGKLKVERPEQEKAGAEEALKRVKPFPKRKQKFVPSIRVGALRLLLPTCSTGLNDRLLNPRRLPVVNAPVAQSKIGKVG